MATITLDRSNDFITAIFLRLELGQALSDGRVFSQNVTLERANGDTENVQTRVRVEGEKAYIEAFRKKTSQHTEMFVPAGTSILDAEKHILSLALDLLLV